MKEILFGIIAGGKGFLVRVFSIMNHESSIPLVASLTFSSRLSQETKDFLREEYKEKKEPCSDTSM